MAKDNYGMRYELTLTHDEVYTMCLLLSHVAGDRESYLLLRKLESVLERELELEDFNRVNVVQEDDQDFAIRIY